MNVLHSIFDLQLFADGGGEGGAPATDGGSSAAEVPSESAEATDRIPLRARKFFDMAKKRSSARTGTVADGKDTVSSTTEKSGRPSYKELIESDEYKAEHEQYMRRVIRDRLKKQEAQVSEMGELLSLMGQKYGLDSSSESFRAELTEAIKADDSVYERYAMEHDVPLDEARKIVELTQRLDRANREAETRRIQEEDARTIGEVIKKGEQTARQYPDFNIREAIRDPRFVRLTAAFGGDTTKAYEALNHTMLRDKAVSEAEQRAKRTVVNSIRANRARPSEGGLSPSSGISSAVPDFRTMSKRELEEWAAEQRRIKMRG